MTKRNTSPKTPNDWPLKAYKNGEFLNSPDGRIVRILSEFVEPNSRFIKHDVSNTIVFFGSARILPKKDAKKKLKTMEAQLAQKKKSSPSLDRKIRTARKAVDMSRYYEEAMSLAEKLTRWSMGIQEKKKQFLICTGGGPGIMEAANRGAKKAGGTSIGLNISLPMEQYSNPYITKEMAFEFHYFFVRKFWFAYMAKAMIIFPGGFGTMDELFEILTLVQSHKTKKFLPIIIYGSEFWSQILDLPALVKHGTISKKDLNLFQFFDDVDSAYEYITSELSNYYLKTPSRWKPGAYL